MLLRTVFAVVLAADSGVGRTDLVTEASDLSRAVVQTVDVGDGRPAIELAASWVESVWGGTVDGGGYASREERLDVLLLPVFQVVSASGLAASIAEVSDFPLVCTVHEDGNRLSVRLDSAADVLNEPELASVAEQFRAAVDTLISHPTSTVEDIAASFRSLRFEVRVVAHAGFEELAPVIEYWADAVGLPAEVTKAELGETLAPNAGGGLAPRPWGANLMLVGGDRCTPAVLPLRTPFPSTGSAGAVMCGRLADGSPIAEVNANETRELFDEIFVRRRYLRHGLSIGDGAMVLDVGANVGMFALFAHMEASRVQVWAFEPAAPVADCLRVNMSAYAIRGGAVEAAVGSRPGERAFTYYPRSSLQSGLYTDPEADEATVRAYIRRQLAQTATPGAEGAGTAADVDALLQGRFASQEYAVELVTLSDWIDRQRPPVIDLLKVDAERGELEVLAGVRDDHWPLIRQVVAEVHDVAGRVAAAESLLGDRGFSVVVEQDPLFAGTEIFMMYARRRGDAAISDVGVRGGRLVEELAAAAHLARVSALPTVVAALPGPDAHAVAADGSGYRADYRNVDLADLQPGPRFWEAAGTRLARQLTASERPATKVIVVDADNLLWGGVCGEVGADRVDVGGPYRAVQGFLADQRARGRLLGLCTRNNLHDVEAVFAAHPDMPLSLADFSAVRAAWGPKSVSVALIADELGCGLESVVFVDDSPAERAEVGIRLPDVAVVRLPTDPNSFVGCLTDTWQLDAEAPTTEEDAARAAQVADEGLRRSLAETSASFRDYLDALDLHIEVAEPREADVERIGQLARRTTQFNLQLRPLMPPDVRLLVAESTVALVVRVRDRYGDYGLVGFVAGSVAGSVLHIDDFFVSCRALGRNVEWLVLRRVAEHAAAAGASLIHLPVRRGDRNAPAARFVEAASARYGPPDGAENLPAAVVSSTLAAGLDWRAALQAEEPAPTAKRGTGGAAPVRRYLWPAPGPEAVSGVRFTRRLGRAREQLAALYVPPSTRVEKEIVEVWEGLLGVAPVGIHDNLFALGGDSLTAMAVCSALRSSCGLDVPVEVLLEAPTVAATAAHIAEAAEGETAAPPPAAAFSDEASPGQRRIWAAEVTGRSGHAQFIPLAYDVAGDVDAARLEEAFRSLIGRHETLRTALRVVDGRLRRRPAKRTFRLRVVDLAATSGSDRSAEAAAADFFSEPFDVEADVMVRAALIRVAAERYVLLVAVHHSAADGWSVGILQRDLSAAYRGASLGGEDRRFGDYVAVTNARAERGDFDDAATRLRARLQPRPVPAPAPAPAQHRTQPLHQRFSIDPGIVDRVRKVARDASTTPFVAFLAAFLAVLAAAENSTDVTVGCPVVNRPRTRDQTAVGFYANVVPIRSQVDWASTGAAHLRSTAATVFEAFARSDVPYGLLQSAPAGDLYQLGPPPFDALFTLQPPPAFPLTLTGCAATSREPALWPLPFPLMVDIDDRATGMSGLVRFNAQAGIASRYATIADAYPLALKAFVLLQHRPLSFVCDLLNEPSAAAAPSALHLREARLTALRQPQDAR